MSADFTSSNPIVQAIMSGTAPPQARMAAARGLLPLAQNELLEVLVALSQGDDAEVAEAARATIAEQEAETLLSIASSAETSSAVLGYLARRAKAGRAVEEAVASTRVRPTTQSQPSPQTPQTQPSSNSSPSTSSA